MFNGIVYNQGLIKSIRKNPKYVSGSRVIEISSKSKTPIISFLEIFNEKIIGKTKIIFYKKLFK